MDPQDERLNERLEQSIRSTMAGMQGEGNIPDEHTAEKAQVDELVDLARQFRMAPQLRVEASFAEMLERRFLRHALRAQQKAAHGRAPWNVWRHHKGVVSLIGLCLLVLLLLGLGLLAQAAQKTNPTNPLYSITQWQRPTKTMPTPTLTRAPDQATLDLQTARLRLDTLLTLTTPAQANDYVQALSLFDSQLTTAVREINVLPTGGEKTQLTSQLSSLKSDARQKLRGLLHTLISTASAATTTELGHLGESIPYVSSASIVLPAHPKETATISITGSGIEAGAQLLINGKPLPTTGALQNGQIVFVLVWTSEKHPHSLGIVNPDGTVAQTSNVTVTTAAKGGNGNGNG